MFKKRQKKDCFRKRKVDDDAEAEGDLPSENLEIMREVQKMRKREKGVKGEVKGDEVQDEITVEEVNQDMLEATFTSQTDGGEVDPNMLKYIEQQMNKADTDDKQMTERSVEEQELYTTPAHLQPKKATQKEGAPEHEDAQRWLAGIMEVPLSVEEKLANIEATEQAKRSMRAEHAEKRRKEVIAVAQNIPGNFNANYHQHRKEFAQMVRSQQGGQRPNAVAVVGPDGGQGEIQVATDGAAVENFRRRENQKRR